MRLKTATAQAATTPPPEVRDQLVMEHVPLVKALAQRLVRRLPPQVEINELISVGVLGLIEAANRYKPSTGVPFDAFAQRRFVGYLRPSGAANHQPANQRQEHMIAHGVHLLPSWRTPRCGGPPSRQKTSGSIFSS